MLLSFLAFTLFTTGCYKEDLPKGTPSCIKLKILKLKNLPTDGKKASIWRWEVGGETFYYVPALVKGAPSSLFDENCNLVCHPEEGALGSGSTKCPQFKEPVKEVQVWQDVKVK